MADIEVDLYGEKVSLPEETAKKLIAKRDEDKQSRRDYDKRIGAIEAEKKAAEEARAKAEADKLAMEAMNDGQVEKAKEILTKAHREREERLAGKYRDKSLAALLGSHPKLIKSAIADVTDQLAVKTKYDPDQDTLVVLDAAGQPLKDDSGKPIPVDTWVNGWLDKRPHYLSDTTPTGSGAKGGKAAGAKEISVSAFEAMSPTDRAKHFADGGTLAQS